MRLFFALDPSRAAVSAIGSVMERLAAVPNLRLVRPEGVHLTLAFLGEVEDLLPLVISAGEDAATGAGRLRLRPSGLDLLPSASRPRVVTLGLWESEPLAELQRRLVLALAPAGYRPEKRVFRPHLTLGRARSALPPDLRRLALALEQPELPDVPGWISRELILYRSHLGREGSRYEALGRFPLE